jgi:spectinomycin phosphotransferase
MLEPPDLPESVIADGIASGYSIDTTAIEFLPIGRDPEAWLYKVTAADGAEFFLKARKSILNPASLTVPRYLSDQGIAEIVPPVPATDGAFSAGIPGFVLILYPFIPNATAALDRSTSRRHWVRYGSVMRRVHSMPLPAQLATAMRRETFASPWIPRLQQVDKVSSMSGGDPLEKEWRAVWVELRPRIMALVERSRELGARLKRMSLPHVICHADIHMWNVLIDDGDGLWFVDWDDVMIAPKECDLFFGIGGLGPAHINPEREQWFREGYGETVVDGEALTYYRCERAISDVAANGETFFDAEAGEVTRRDALEGLRDLFLPGRIADLADAPVN